MAFLKKEDEEISWRKNIEGAFFCEDEDEEISSKKKKISKAGLEWNSRYFVKKKMKKQVAFFMK